MSEPRFVVRSISGWSIGDEGRRSSHYSTSYWVLDLAYHKNVSGGRIARVVWPLDKSVERVEGSPDGRMA